MELIEVYAKGEGFYLLKPCPLCGETENVDFDDEDYSRIECRKCGLVLYNWDGGAKNMVDKWNALGGGR